MSFSPALALYRALSWIAGAGAGAWLSSRARRGKEDAARIGERYARYAQARPGGAVVWLHAASIGESGVALTLIEALAARDPSLSFLLSTGTRTSAELVARRAPQRTTHVYAPLDRPDVVRRFFDHWRPDLGVFVESEVWPNLILEAHARRVPLALVNARMSPKSLRQWRSLPAAAHSLLSAFAFVSAADARTAAALSELRGRPVNTLGNLKLAAPAPRIDARAKEALAKEIGGRRLWLAASTHHGEDVIALNAHHILRQTFPDALLIIAPRHPERGEAISNLAGDAPLRSRGRAAEGVPCYIADTLGELGMLYDLAPVSLVAGSLLPHLKGHNPVEPARLGSAMITGPYVESFEDLFDDLFAAGGAAKAASAEDLAETVKRLWSDETARAAQVGAARAVIAKGADAAEQTVTALQSLLPVHAETRAADASA
ncbi:MAG TPA: 3-deoxy-D-manno-octulosonic acid transferase [Candidatus Binatia bacterium]|nr:3-deoxy-D-manno-octulosonic acid transferase [Candidatus Binatia bacterium]